MRIGQLRLCDVRHLGVGRYVGFTPMWERTICGFRGGVVGYSIPLNRLYPRLNRPRLGYTPGYIMA